MRKLLTILGAVTLMASTASVVVSCKTKVKRFDTPSLSEQLYEKIIAGLKNNPDFTWAVGPDFNNIKFQEVLGKMINEIISKDYVEDSQAKFAKNLNLQTNNSITSKTMMDAIASNEMFVEYTASLMKGAGNSLDETIRKNLGELNPSFLKNDDQGNIDLTDYSIWFKDGENYKRWQIWNEFPSQSDKNKKQLPSIPLLSSEAKDFYVLGNATKQVGTMTKAEFESLLPAVVNNEEVQKDKPFIFKEGKQYAFNGTQILKYRFQNYFKTNIEPKYFENLLTTSYINGEMYTVNDSSSTSFTNKAIFLDKTSAIAKSVQNWTSSTDAIKSNIKMVWNFSLDNSKSALDSALAKVESMYDKQGRIIPGKTATDIWEALSGSDSDSTANASEAGTDSFLKLSGFNGFVKNGDNTVESVQGNLVISDDSKKEIFNADGPTFLTNKGKGYTSSKTGKTDFVLVIPVYLTDIINSTDIQANQSTTGAEGTAETVNNNLTMKMYKNSWTSLTDKFNTSDSRGIDWDGVTGTGNLKVIGDPSKGYFAKLVSDIGNNGELTGTLQLKNGTKINVSELTEDGNALLVNELIDEEKGKSFFGNDFVTGDKFSYNVFTNSTTSSSENARYFRTWNNSTGNLLSKASTDIMNLNSSAKQSLISELQFIASKDSKNTEAAKTKLYTLYLTEDSILYKALYDSLKGYIKDEDEDSD